MSYNLKQTEIDTISNARNHVMPTLFMLHRKPNSPHPFLILFIRKPLLVLRELPKVLTNGSILKDILLATFLHIIFYNYDTVAEIYV